jgi:hypothetical protein
MANPPFSDGNEARNALRRIVSDPAYGVAALSSSQVMANLLKDLLPDAPREVSILVAAAEAGVVSNLQDHISQGMDVGTASTVVAGSFAARTPFRPEACSWAVSEMAVALGLDPGGRGAPQGNPPPAAPLGSMTAAPGVASGGYQPGGFPPTGHVEPQGTYQPGAAPPQDAYQPGQVPQRDAYPPGQVPPPSRYPPGQYPPGQYPPGQYPPGQVPPGSAYPPGQVSPQQGYAPGGYQPGPVPGYWPPQQQGYPPVTKTNGLAIASLVLGIVWIAWLGSLAGLVLGLVALRQIKNRHERGRGIAIAGVVLSGLWLALLIVSIIIASVATRSPG